MKQIVIYHIYHLPRGSHQGRLRSNHRRKGEKHWGAGEELQNHHNTKADQYRVRTAE
jgi:hypothetical protein